MIDKKIIEDLKDSLKKITNEKKLFEEKNIFNKKFISPLYKDIAKVEGEAKKKLGQKINDFKKEIDDIFDARIVEMSKEMIASLKSDFDPLIHINDNFSGGINPIENSIMKINHFFSSLNFEIVDGDEIVSTKYNFDHLNIDENHPARDLHDTFFIDKNLILRTHCTSVSSKMIENNQSEDIKIISYGNVYRKDEDDATHSHQFNQVDLIWIKKGLSVSHLKWLIDSFLKYFFEDDQLETRYRLSYFPFTEPSFEVDMGCFKCNKKGCHVCKRTGWIEVLGSGIFNPKVIQAANLDSTMIGLAAGIGIDRITMIKHGISDIRHLYNNDFRILSQFKGGK
ncbi:MAG: phenylalanine--tRNA ligase subunit alpha [Mycoplasmoidaceae bacterium]